MHPDDVEAIYLSLLEQARQLFGVEESLFPTPDLIVAEDAQSSSRSFAYFQVTEGADPPTIAISPELNEDQTVALLAHELGHWVHYCIGREGIGEVLEVVPRSSERLADSIGEALLDCPIGYDSREIQTIDPDEIVDRPRPAELG